MALCRSLFRFRRRLATIGCFGWQTQKALEQLLPEIVVFSWTQRGPYATSLSGTDYFFDCFRSASTVNARSRVLGEVFLTKSFFKTFND
jgi:hypothetical protein